jgi:segregation and condensation protein B
MTESMETKIETNNIAESLGPDLSSAEGDASDAEQLDEEQPKCFLALRSQVEAVLFANDGPMKTVDVQEIIGDGYAANEVNECIHGLVAEYEERSGGFRLVYLKGHGYQFQTVPGASPLMERQFASRPRPLSRAAQETLAIVAYRQPVTRAEIEFIRGVDAGSIVKGLIERGFIKCTGRKEVPGRPMLFGTTDTFLHTFGIENLDQLAPLEAFQPAQDMVKKAVEAIENDEDPDEAEKKELMADADQLEASLDVSAVVDDAVLPKELQELKDQADRSQTQIEKILGTEPDSALDS